MAFRADNKGPFIADQVIRLGDADVPQAADVLCEAFLDYPVMRYVIGVPEPEYSQRLQSLIRFFVMARSYRSELILGLGEGTELHAVATISYPDNTSLAQELTDMREKVWHELGSDARARYARCVDAWSSFESPVKRVHVNMIGVRRERQSRGLGRRLLDYIHDFSAAKSGSVGVTLDTESPSNVDLYRHLGYHVTGHAQIMEGLETWRLFRPV